jgi:hypothetical protein
MGQKANLSSRGSTLLAEAEAAEAASLNADHRAMEKARRCDARRAFRFPNARH